MNSPIHKFRIKHEDTLNKNTIDIIIDNCRRLPNFLSGRYFIYAEKNFSNLDLSYLVFDEDQFNLKSFEMLSEYGAAPRLIRLSSLFEIKTIMKEGFFL